MANQKTALRAQNTTGATFHLPVLGIACDPDVPLLLTKAASELPAVAELAAGGALALEPVKVAAGEQLIDAPAAEPTEAEEVAGEADDQTTTNPEA